MKIVVLRRAQKELEAAPLGVRADVIALFEDLEAGKTLSLPISRPLPSIAKGLHELRLSHGAGEYRVFYVIKIGSAIYVLHATSKKTQKMDKRITDVIHARLRSLGL